MSDWSKVISAGVAPVIVISACGLLCLAFYNRLAAIVTRLRAFDRERLSEQDALRRTRAASAVDEIQAVRHVEILGMLEIQTRGILRRARHIRATILCLLITIISLATCCMLLGASAYWPDVTPLAACAAALFIIGLFLLITSVTFAMLEIKHALDPVDLESRFVREIGEDFDRL
jgi:hypothetical protein